MDWKTKYGPIALVAGASEGLGVAFARGLASRGMDLILVARRTVLLEAVCLELEKKYAVKAFPVTCDLSSGDALERIRENIANREVGVLVYNAAESYIGPLLDCGEERLERMSFINVVTPQKLILHFGSQMVGRRKGGIVLMSSLAGFQGSGFLIPYAAAKAFSRVFAEGLWYEWKEKGVDVVACCAGATSTPNYINSHPGKISFFQPPLQTPDEVAEECLARLGKTPSFVTGRANRLVSFLMNRFFSRKRAVTIMGDATRKLYGL